MENVQRTTQNLRNYLKESPIGTQPRLKMSTVHLHFLVGFLVVSKKYFIVNKSSFYRKKIQNVFLYCNCIQLYVLLFLSTADFFKHLFKYGDLPAAIFQITYELITWIKTRCILDKRLTAIKRFNRIAKHHFSFSWPSFSLLLPV